VRSLKANQEQALAGLLGGLATSAKVWEVQDMETRETGTII